MIVRVMILLLVSVLLLWGTGCGLTESATPVATPAVGLNRTRVPLGGPLEVTYRFTPAVAGLGATDDYRVFVHFIADDGELMFTDDHDPPVQTSTWEVGQEVSWDRRTIIPVYPYIGDVTVAVGLYSPPAGDRLPLAGEHIGQRAYAVASLNMAPQSESGFLLFEEGWHSTESAPVDPTLEWQWTTERATIAFRNPQADSSLYLEIDGRPEAFESPQVLTLMVGDTTVETITVSSPRPTFHTIDIPATSFGANEMVVLTLNVDPTFVPAETTDGENPDTRELGIQVFYAFLEPK